LPSGAEAAWSWRRGPISATVIVPTNRGVRTIGGLLDSLEGQTATHQLLAVDNASVDGTSEVLAKRSAAEVVRLERNVGFGAAVNRAAERAEGDVLVLVNDDCVCDPGFVEAICAPMDPAAGVVMAAGVLRQARDEHLIDTAGMELDQTLLVFDYLNGEPLQTLDQRVDDPIGPCGAAAAFDRRAFLEAGGFDETLFAYWEDVDLVLRLRLSGGRCALAASARGTHLHSETLGSGSSAKNRLIGFGRGYLLHKWSVLSPTRFPAVLARDGVICLGQAVVDRNLAGASGRLRGWRAADRTLPYPVEALAGNRGPGLMQTLARRLRRRRRLWRQKRRP
jgi:GT2 family glycosyltransferase